MAYAANPQKIPYEINHISTPYANSAQPRAYKESLMRHSAEADSTTLDYLPESREIRRLLAAVDQVRDQGADWDDQEGTAVSLETSQRTKLFLFDLARRAGAGGWTWASPAVSATPEGGIHLSWHVSKNRVTLTFRASSSEVVCVSKLNGGTSQREVLPASEAVARVLSAFETASPAAASTGRTLG